jgi:hypothetical protein
VPVCPHCGEEQRLTGRPDGAGIRVTCEVCETTWRRGEPRCKGCGRTGGVPHRQVMTRTPRGNQLAVVGHREIVLCPVCDADAVAAARTAAVPEHYVSVFLAGRAPDREEQRAEAGPPRAAIPAPDTSPPDVAERDSEAAPAARARPEARGAVRPPTPPSASASAQPTIRQAVEDFMTAHPGSDSLALLLVGRQLGPSLRVSGLDEPERVQALRAWVDDTWPDVDRNRVARATVAGLVGHCHSRGWTTTTADDVVP